MNPSNIQVQADQIFFCLNPSKLLQHTSGRMYHRLEIFETITIFFKRWNPFKEMQAAPLQPKIDLKKKKLLLQVMLPFHLKKLLVE